jgi:hypothetical protein
VALSVRGIDKASIDTRKGRLHAGLFLGVSHPGFRQEGRLPLAFCADRGPTKNKISTGAELPLAIGYCGAAG